MYPGTLHIQGLRFVDCPRSRVKHYLLAPPKVSMANDWTWRLKRITRTSPTERRGREVRVISTKDCTHAVCNDRNVHHRIPTGGSKKAKEGSRVASRESDSNHLLNHLTSGRLSGILLVGSAFLKNRSGTIIPSCHHDGRVFRYKRWLSCESEDRMLAMNRMPLNDGVLKQEIQE